MDVGLIAGVENLGHSLGATIVVAAGTTPSPDPTHLRPGLTSDQVTPGLAGFLAIFFVAVVSVGLFFALTRQLRRTRRNAARAEAEREAGDRPDDVAGGGIASFGTGGAEAGADGSGGSGGKG